MEDKTSTSAIDYNVISTKFQGSNNYANYRGGQLEGK